MQRQSCKMHQKSESEVELFMQLGDRRVYFCTLIFFLLVFGFYVVYLH